MSEFILVGRIVILDSLLTLFVTIALLAAYRAVQAGRVRWYWWLGSALSCGLAVLTKGPVGLVLLVPPMMAFGWLNRGACAAELAPLGRLSRRGRGAGGSLVCRYHLSRSPFRLPLFRRSAPGSFLHARVPRRTVVVFRAGAAGGLHALVVVPGPVRAVLVRPVVGCAGLAFAVAGFLPPVGWLVHPVFQHFVQQAAALYFAVLPALPLVIGSYLDLVLFQAVPALLFQQVRTVVPRLAQESLPSSAWSAV